MERHKKFSSIGNDLTHAIMKENKIYVTKRKIDKIVIHCSFSPQGRGDDSHTIDQWHLKKKWSGIGYHYVVLEDGTIQKGRWADYQGAHAKGFNKGSIAICRIGGMRKDGTAVEDVMPQQELAIRKLARLHAEEHNLSYIDIYGHSELPDVNKSCPLMNMNRIRNISY